MKKNDFSLAELIVSVAVFLLIMVMMLNFFSGAREIWIGTRGRGDVFVEAKAALDVVSNLLSQARMIRENGNYTIFEPTGDGVDRLSFLCRTGMPLTESALGGSYPGDGVFFVRVELDTTDDELVLYAASASDGANRTQYINAIEGTETVSDIFSALSGSIDQEVLLERVTSFEVWPGYYDTNGELAWGNAGSRPIEAVKLSVGILKESDYQTYEEIKSDYAPADLAKFLQEKELTFSRIVYFDFAATKGNRSLVP